MAIVGDSDYEWDVPVYSSTDTRWFAEARCARVLGPGEADTVFFQVRGLERARRICKFCPVKDHCLAFAIRFDMVGVWGGLTKAERLELSRRSA